MLIQSLKPISISPDKARLPNLGAVHPSMRPGQDKTREAFQSFVGETLFGQMLKSMRKTVGKTPYFNGGRAEEVFQQQLDQVLAQNEPDQRGAVGFADVQSIHDAAEVSLAASGFSTVIR